MWRSSSKPAAAGFTLMEVLVVLASLGMILWMAGQLLFPMRQAAERQRLQVEARQAARSAADYAAFVVRGATDMNNFPTPPNPAAVLTYLWKGANASAGTFPACPGDGGCVQLSYNNVDQATTQFATEGTDVVTLTVATVTDPAVFLEAAHEWPNPFTSLSTQYWAFDFGCAPGGPAANAAANDAANFTRFKQVVPPDPADPTKSLPLIVWEPSLAGRWLIYRITDYRNAANGTTCTVLDPNCVVAGVNVPCVQVGASPDDVTGLNPPGGDEQLSGLPNLVIGSQFRTLRVCDGWLEQKNGVFDPGTDNNCPVMSPGALFPTWDELVATSPQPGWSPLLPNVEDFQVAYIYLDGQTWNRPGSTLGALQGCNDGVPLSNMGTPANLDVRRVVALRITVTGRSSTPVGPVAEGKIAARPPAAEDHDTAAYPVDTFYHYQVSTTAMMRNRTPRS